MSKIGRYEILYPLGTGGMAEVLLGRTTGEGGFEKLVAIKRILPSMTANESFVKMFIDEARISAKLNHSAIGQIFEFGRAGESYFIAMEFIQGMDLRAIHKAFRLQKSVPPAPMAAYIIANVCSALEYAHSKRDSSGEPLGIIHRDLSPSNVLVSFAGEVKLIDFGIAKAAQRLYVTVGANLKGKYAYMSPEQATGTGTLDHRSDIFGAGTLLFELLTGRNPFRAKTDIDTLTRVQGAKVPAPSRVVPEVPEEMDQICLKALSLKPEDRFQSAGEMQEALESFSRRTAFGSRKMGRWMSKSFAEEMRDNQQKLMAARKELEAKGGLQIVPTGEIPGGSGDEVEEVVIPLARPKSGGTPSGTPAGTPVNTPVGVPLQPGQAGVVSGTAGTPSGAGTPPPERVHQATGPVVIEPAFAGSDPQSSSFTPFSGSDGPLSPQATLAVHRLPHRSRETSIWVHVAVFSVIVLAGAAVLYFFFGKGLPLGGAAKGPVVGTLKIQVEPPLPAQVFINDDLRGDLPAGGAFLAEELLPGKHRIRLEGPRIQTLENVVEVTRGKVTELYLRVQPAAAAADAGGGG